MERLFRWKGKEPIGGSKEKDKTLATTEGSSLSHKSQDRETPNAVTGKERKIYGLKVLHQPSDYTKAIVDIVFVHGITGSAYDTWLDNESGVHWPTDLLRNDVANARILAFGYDADVVHFWSPVSQNRISNHAENLLGALTHLREWTDSENRKIVFIAHSLGGIVTQSALCLSKNSAESHIQQIGHCTIAIAFLGTPHHGADLAAWAKFGTNIAQIVKRTNTDIVSILRSGSEMLANIQNGFHNILRTRKGEGTEIAITCFYEELPLPMVGEVVPKHSAILPGYGSYSIHANHIAMTKFSNSDDNGYGAILGEIRRWTKQASNAVIKPLASPVASPTASPVASADDELLHAAAIGDSSRVRKLLEMGANINYRDPKSKQTALLLADENEHKDLVNLLLKWNGVDLNVKDGKGQTLMSRIVGRRDETMITALLKQGINSSLHFDEIKTLLSRAMKKKDKSMVSLLLEQGLDADLYSREIQSLVWWTMHGNDETFVKLLLERGIDPGETDGFQPMICSAARNGSVAVVQLLLDNGANLEATGMSGWTPLLYAAYYGHAAVVRQLLDKGADPNCQSSYWETPLMRAADAGHAIIARLLLDGGANLRTKDLSRQTALHHAAKSGHAECVAALLERRDVKIEARDDKDKTPLYCAAENGHEDVVKLLLEGGANPDVESSTGMTPLQLAISTGDRHVVEVLQKHVERVKDPT